MIPTRSRGVRWFARSGLTVLALEASGAKTIVVKIAWDEAAERQIEREAHQLEELHADPRIAGWCELTPTLVKRGAAHGRSWVAQSHRDGSPTPTDRIRDDVIRSTLNTIAGLHDLTAVEASGDELLRTVREPMAVLTRTFPDLARSLVPTAGQIESYLAARPHRVGRIHGDLAPSNLLWHKPAGSISGVVDWELSDPGLPAEIDRGHFVLAYTAEVGRLDYGRLVARCLTGDWSAVTRGGLAGLDGPNHWPADLSVLVAWLHHTSANLTKTARFRGNPIWFNANVAPVVGVLHAGALEGRF